MDIFKDNVVSSCPNADNFFDYNLNLPIHQHLSEDDVYYIIDKLRDFKQQ